MAGFAYYVIQRNDTTNDSIFHMSGGMQGVYSKMLGVVRILINQGKHGRPRRAGDLEPCLHAVQQRVRQIAEEPPEVSFLIL